jgi:uncharacterized protein (TIGR02284 family)
MADRTERDVLNDLIVTCRDAARGFEWAAEHARDPDLRRIFTVIAEERRSYAEDLLPHAQRLGGHSDAEGSAAATLHRAWISLKDRLSGNSDEALIAEAERGERVAISTYAGALAGMLPPHSRDLIEAQYEAIKATQGRLRTVAAK